MNWHKVQEDVMVICLVVRETCRKTSQQCLQIRSDLAPPNIAASETSHSQINENVSEAIGSKTSNLLRQF